MRTLTTYAPIAALVLAVTGTAAMAENDDGVYLQSSEVRRMQTAHEKFILFDAREKRDYDRAHVTGAVLPLPTQYYNDMELFRQKILSDRPDKSAALSDAMKHVPKTTKLVTYCNRNCQSSRVMAEDLRRMGFEQSFAMKEGLQGWQEMGYPVEGREAVTIAAPEMLTEPIPVNNN